MYAFIDRPVRSLDTGSRALLWAMRQWVLAIGTGQNPVARLAPMFERAGIIGALPGFHAMMSMLNLHARQNMAFAPQCCTRVAEDEALMLALLADMGHRPDNQNTATLTLLVDGAHVAPMQTAMALVADRMHAAGIAPGQSHDDARQRTPDHE